MSSHEQGTYPITSLNRNGIEFKFETDRNYYVDLRQIYLALKLKIVKCRGYETYNIKVVNKEHKEEAKMDEEMGRTKKLQFFLFLMQTNFALKFFQGLGVHQQPANVQIRWTLCQQVLPFQYH